MSLRFARPLLGAVIVSLFIFIVGGVVIPDRAFAAQSDPTPTPAPSKSGVTYWYLVHNLANTYAPGQNLILDIYTSPHDGASTIDWATATFTVTFTGPSTVTYANVKANGSNQVVIAAPKARGQYQMVCNFNGSAKYQSALGDSMGVLVSGGHSTGTIRLYTNPTKLPDGQFATLFVVVPAAPGLPTPTGDVGFGSGRSYTQTYRLSANGTLSIKLPMPIGVSGDGVQVYYHGDSVYNAETASFGATNPPIPGSGGTGSPPSTKQPAPIATPKKPVAATPTAGATKTPGMGKTPTAATVTPTPHTTPTAGAATGASKGDDGASPGATPVVLGTLSFLALAASGVGCLFLWRRRLNAPLAATDAPWPHASAAPER